MFHLKPLARKRTVQGVAVLVLTFVLGLSGMPYYIWLLPGILFVLVDY